jgi:hypothetical protein
MLLNSQQRKTNHGFTEIKKKPRENRRALYIGMAMNLIQWLRVSHRRVDQHPTDTGG